MEYGTLLFLLFVLRLHSFRLHFPDNVYFIYRNQVLAQVDSSLASFAHPDDSKTCKHGIFANAVSENLVNEIRSIIILYCKGKEHDSTGVRGEVRERLCEEQSVLEEQSLKKDRRLKAPGDRTARYRAEISEKLKTAREKGGEKAGSGVTHADRRCP